MRFLRRPLSSATKDSRWTEPDNSASDSSAALKKFEVESMGTSVMKCAAHPTGKTLFTPIYSFFPHCTLLTVSVQLFENRANFTRRSLATNTTTKSSTLISFTPVTAHSRYCVGYYVTRFAPGWSRWVKKKLLSGSEKHGGREWDMNEWLT